MPQSETLSDQSERRIRVGFEPSMLVERSLEQGSSEPSGSFACSNMLRTSRAEASARGSSTSKPPARGFEPSRNPAHARLARLARECSKPLYHISVAYSVAYKSDAPALYLTVCMLHTCVSCKYKFVTVKVASELGYTKYHSGSAWLDMHGA